VHAAESKRGDTDRYQYPRGQSFAHAGFSVVPA
jgi:hypothetical protein